MDSGGGKVVEQIIAAAAVVVSSWETKKRLDGISILAKLLMLILMKEMRDKFFMNPAAFIFRRLVST